MDYVITHWQEIASIGIVALATVLLIRAGVKERKNKKDCSGCSLVEIRNKQKYTLHKH